MSHMASYATELQNVNKVIFNAAVQLGAKGMDGVRVDVCAKDETVAPKAYYNYPTEKAKRGDIILTGRPFSNSFQPRTILRVVEGKLVVMCEHMRYDREPILAAVANMSDCYIALAAARALKAQGMRVALEAIPGGGWQAVGVAA